MGKSRRNKLHKLEDALVDPNLLAGLFSHSAATLWADTHRRSRRELLSLCAPGPTCQSWDAGSWGTASGASPQTPPPLWSSPPSACTLGCPWCLTSKQTPCAEFQIRRECWGIMYVFAPQKKWSSSFAPTLRVYIPASTRSQGYLFVIFPSFWWQLKIRS